MKHNYTTCSNDCLLKTYSPCKADYEIKVGGSKNHNIGFVFNNFLIIERLAKDWDEQHLYGYNVSREALNIDNNHINNLMSINNDHILKIYSYCSCSVQIEFINGWLFNSHKERYILFDDAYKEDFLDVCTLEQLISSIEKIAMGLLELHNHLILHTDLTDFNVMVRKDNFQPVIIDLLGTIPAGTQAFEESLDIKVFVEHFLVPTLCSRKELIKKEDLLSYFDFYNREELIKFIIMLRKYEEKEGGYFVFKK